MAADCSRCDRAGKHAPDCPTLATAPLPAEATGKDGHPFFCQVHPTAHSCFRETMRAALVSPKIDASPSDLLAACVACYKARPWATVEYLEETPLGPRQGLKWRKLKPSPNLKVGPGAAAGHEARGAVVEGIWVEAADRLSVKGPACNLRLSPTALAESRYAAFEDLKYRRQGPGRLAGTCTRYGKLPPFMPAPMRDGSISHDHALADGTGYFPCDGLLEGPYGCACAGCACPNPMEAEPRWGGICIGCSTGHHVGRPTLEVA